ncbi:hypothetical protein N5C39_22515 [Enterobacter bugandensis]|uniref:Uncharacterized protein n=1 Tax=Enterobacter bugandensis TaxID=881260 RepID=A0AA42TR90_9ENTR|nr:hypothetical protein [Enterobacter bugandensis]MDH1321149.1 hypothetical protein [Enterobacter bugandensis]
MSDEFSSLLFPRRTEPDDFKDHTEEIIWQMRNGYRRHHGIVEQPPEVKKLRAAKNERN